MELVERLRAQVEADKKGEKLPKNHRLTLEEALASTDLAVFLHKTIVDTVKDSAEPMYIASKMLRRVNITEGRSIVFPAMSDIVVGKVGEMGNYPRATTEIETFEAMTEFSVEKIGVMVCVSDEMIDDSQWDVVGMMLEKAGRAMARYKEEWCFREFSRHGHIVFDPVKAKDGGVYANLATHGLGADRTSPNDTLSVGDFIDLMIGTIANGYQVTDIIMHPLVWPIFAKNPLLDKLSIAAFGGSSNQITISPDQIQGKLPFAVNIQLTPFVPFNVQDRTFDMYIVDRNEIGVLVVKEDISIEQWDEPARDIRNIKFKERYAPGILNNGKAISVAANIAYDQTYPEPDMVKLIE